MFDVDQTVMRQDYPSNQTDSPDLEASDSDLHAPPSTIRSMFLSDMHLGSKFCYADELYDFLTEHRPQKLYLVGDLIDGRKLSQAWHWPQIYTRLLERLFELGQNGTRVYYLPGNHDEFMRNIQKYFGYGILKSLPMVICDEVMHITPDGRKFMVLHGDKFDHHEVAAGWVSRMTALTYDWLLRGSRLTHQLLPQWFPHRYSFAQKIKTRSNTFVKFVAKYQNEAVNYAHERHCDGIICGHIHQPMIESHDKITYCNTGDWVEHCSALVEYESGEMDLLYYDQWKQQTRLSPTSSETEFAAPPNWKPRSNVEIPLNSALPSRSDTERSLEPRVKG
jgi:UDP-2,3-diacylglucosamine pyrophosphatase LpxH